MSQQETLYGKIDLYLSGGLSEKDKLAFEQELALRPDWQQKVDAYRLTKQMILENHLLEIKGTLSEVHEKHGMGKKIALYSAGLLLVAAGSISWYYTRDSTPSVSSTIPVKEIIKAALPSKEEKPLPIIEPRKEVSSKQSDAVKEAPTVVSIDIPQEVGNTQNIQEPIGVPPIDLENKVSQVVSYENEKASKPSDPCAHIVLEASVYTTSTCEGEENGSVSLSAFKGGKSPYKWSLKDAQQQTIATSGLPKGAYHAIVFDAHNCSTTFQGIEIKEKHCEKAHHFNPFIGEKWEIPLQTVAGKLTVLDKSGNVYFSIELPAGSQEYWSGESTQGELKTGIYLFTITHSDGTVKRGTVSIVR